MSALGRVTQSDTLQIENLSLSGPPRKFFYPVGGEHLEKMGVISEIFNRILTPLYGSQDKAIEQIRESKDRKAFLMYEEEVPVGVLVFKTVLSDEFAQQNIRKSVEIKSLFVDQSSQNSGRGLGSALVDKLKEEVEKMGLGHEGIHVTVSETKQESLFFFQKKGFQIAHAWKDRYIKGVTEYLLSCPAKIEKIEAARVPSTSIDGKRVISIKESSIPELVHIIHSAHLDDIHGLKKLSDGTFVSGSKDNCVYKWNSRGEVVKIVDEVEPTNQNDRNWITAMEVLNDDYFITGDRSGKVKIWSTSGEFVREVKLKLPNPRDYVSHEFNQRRVNCLAPGVVPTKPSFFVGFPTIMDEFSFIDNRTTTSTKLHDNDWAYCIHPLNSKEMLAVVGGSIDLWGKEDKKWEYKDKIVSEEKKYWTQINGKKRQVRPFISALTPLSSDKSLFGYSMFNGSVRTVDITTKKITANWQEHTDRVWAVEQISEHVIASSSDDRSIKFYDLRERKSIHTIPDHIGSVTSLLKFDSNTLLAGSCPPNVIGTNTGAQIRFYDIRSFS